MNFLDTFRRELFWFLDQLRGGIIKKDLDEICKIQENFYHPESETLRKTYLNDLLEHARQTTPFYEPYKNANSLRGFPVINKNIIRANYPDFRSNFNSGRKLQSVSTSGSTGTPFVVYQGKRKRRRHRADTIFFAAKAGYKLGSRLFYMRVWTESSKKSRLVSWLQNVETWDIRRLNAAAFEKLVTVLQKKGEKGIISAASALEALCKYLDEKEARPMKCNLNSIIANNDRLNEYTKKAVEKYFMTPVVSRYSNAENGILSQQEIGGDGSFEINWASYYIEILDDQDEPVAPGEYGRVVVTDLFNYSMPMIRYDTGDIASLEIKAGKAPSFKRVEGRKLDLVYDTKGNLLSAYLIGTLMMNYQELRQFQFIQEGPKEYRFKLNTAGEFLREAELLAEFKACLGPDSIITVEYLDEIPLLASGKRKQVMNVYTTKQKTEKHENILI